MSSAHSNILKYFQLRPFRSAKVSEISEATAASAVPSEERVNFHIGHPVQDEMLNREYFRLVTGLPYPLSQMNPEDKDQLLQQLGWENNTENRLNFFQDIINKSAPYLPRGGYIRSEPGPLIEYLKEWLTTDQNEPLSYEFGQDSPQRECMLHTGGTWEALRILFQSLSMYLIHQPAKILFYDTNLPKHLQSIPGLIFLDLGKNEYEAFEQIKRLLAKQPDKPAFLLSGSLMSETIRRKLRQFSLHNPLLFIEINEAPNHLSLAREAKMQNRVIRILSVKTLMPELGSISTGFILGNADLIKIMETVQFELKGTPSVTEIELVVYLLRNRRVESGGEQAEDNEKSLADSAFPLQQKSTFDAHLRSTGIKLEKYDRFADRISKIIEKSISTIQAHEHAVSKRIQAFPYFFNEYSSTMTTQAPGEMVDLFFRNVSNLPWLADLSDNFLNAFNKHHPEYDRDRCLVVSGSARTALSLLGFHCGIKNGITPDLGWTYEHCFQSVETISLREDFSLDIPKIIQGVEQKIETEPDWTKSSAVIFNNPHNATGHISNENEIRHLLRLLFERGIYVIDDLSYQNVLPENSLAGPKSLKQLALELVQLGYLRENHLRYLITVHSLSKTDCFAGARLAVIEIIDSSLHDTFKSINESIAPNYLAILLAFLFYRNEINDINTYWLLRNRIFEQRMQALLQAVADLPEDRNFYGLEILSPQGSMYPHLVVNHLPNGISLDWLSTRLATRGIGLIPLSTFARTARGFETARKSFRLTLGGTENPRQLIHKTRRLLIDLNRLIANTESHYNLRTIHERTISSLPKISFSGFEEQWAQLSKSVIIQSREKFVAVEKKYAPSAADQDSFLNEFIPSRLNILYQLIQDRITEAETILDIAVSDTQSSLIHLLSNEFYKESIDIRSERFRKRLFDRTVHPTQMYALKTDILFQIIADDYFNKRVLSGQSAGKLSQVLTDEYFGLNVPISSIDEADELVLDLKSVIAAEKFIGRNTTEDSPILLSFWGDWDGSNRPSGQGHRLIAAAVLENVTQMANLIMLLLKFNDSVDIDPALLNEINQLPLNKQQFWKLLNNITRLTNQLEKRYRGFIPLEISYGKFKRLTTRMHLSKDPLTALWQHNDRLEKRMYHMRQQRRQSLEYYFSLNKRLRKALHRQLPEIQKSLHHPEIAIAFGKYRDLLKRFVLSPRIHQRIIISDDPFTIDTTVHNLLEINEIAGKYGNPGMVLGLQVSMSTEPDAFITLDRKLISKREEILRSYPDSNIPPIWIIPLFEDLQSINNIEGYLEKIWSYALLSHRLNQTRDERFTEMICEIFIAGSDLSQQVGQAAASSLYGQAKLTTMRWLAEHGLVEKVRLKFGSGESMQRQGGYYDTESEKPFFIKSEKNTIRLRENLKESTRKSIEFAKSPLRGVLATGDLRTFQSAISEKIRHLPVKDRANLFFHIKQIQIFHDSELERISEPLLDTRLQFKNRGLQELESFIRGDVDSTYQDFLHISTKIFRQILYGQEEDVVGIHIISHFISRSLPELRDRPTVRPRRQLGKAQGQQIIERLAETLPLCKHGSMLRAIGHNRAQTMVLGVNQLTTGLFRALDEFTNQPGNSGDVRAQISNRILPYLPVREILLTLFLYHDPELDYVKKIEKAFTAGNSSLLLLREDMDSIQRFIGLFQKEYIRRLGLDINDFFDGDVFIPALLPVLRPENAVLMQEKIFNTDFDSFIRPIGDNADQHWYNQIKSALNIPQEIKYWRNQIWQAIEQPIYDQVRSFVELARAITMISSGSPLVQQTGTSDISEITRIGTQIARLLRSTGDDSYRQFLVDVVQLLTQIPGKYTELPVDIIRALRDVERIVKIEEQVLSGTEQDRVRFFLMQIARRCGDNG